MKFLNIVLASVLTAGGAYGSCADSLSMTQLTSIKQTGGIVFGDLRFEPASWKNIRDILPSTSSPTYYTAQANLRNMEESDDRVITCTYGYKSVGGPCFLSFPFGRPERN